MGEAEVRYLSEIGEDCQGVLGSGILLLRLEREDADDGVRLVARYQLRKTAWESRPRS